MFKLGLISKGQFNQRMQYMLDATRLKLNTKYYQPQFVHLCLPRKSLLPFLLSQNYYLLHFPPPRKVLIQQTIVISAFSHITRYNTRIIHVFTEISYSMAVPLFILHILARIERQRSRILHPFPVLGRLLLVLSAHVVVQLAAFLQLLEFGHELPGELINKFSMILNNDLCNNTNAGVTSGLRPGFC